MNRRASQSTFRFRPQKKLGQHFLNNPQIIHKIISRARFRGTDVVLEIGPGKGALTLPLAKQVRKVIAVEKDAQLISLLEKRLLHKGITNVTLFEADILTFDFRKIDLPPPDKVQVIGNLPYNISTPILEKLIGNRGRLSRAVLMFQLEIAERLTASPGSRPRRCRNLGPPMPWPHTTPNSIFLGETTGSGIWPPLLFTIRPSTSGKHCPTCPRRGLLPPRPPLRTRYSSRAAMQVDTSWTPARSIYPQPASGNRAPPCWKAGAGSA